MTTQLEKDLLRNAADRLGTWTADTVMRCKVVDLDNRETLAIIMTMLCFELFRVLSLTTRATPETLGKLIQQQFEDYQKKRERWE